MRKHFLSLFGVFGAVIAVLLLLISIARAENSSPWINSELVFEKEAETQSLPPTFSSYGNIDCVGDASSCSISTLYGTATTNNAVNFNGTDDFYYVHSYLEAKKRYIPIPNSNTAITYLTSPVFGAYMYFNHNFSSSVELKFPPGEPKPVYQIVYPPHGKMADRANNRLAADPASMSFSTNGSWMIVSIPNIAVARVNLKTFEVLPFGTKFDYGIGLPPDAKTAITNDGRYAAVASKNQGRFILYDLDTCAAVPSTINEPVYCQSRDLKDFMKQQVDGYDAILQTRFLNNDLLALYASYKVGEVSKKARFLIGNTNITSKIDYLALGDSFISGEGAFSYQAGTDKKGNDCHLSLVSYPYLIGRDLSYTSYHSIACSGAVMDDITDSSDAYRGQVEKRKGKQRSERSREDIDSIFASFKPGYINQSDFVSWYRPKIINLAIVGNDIGFSSIVKKCALPWNLDNCYESYEDRLELVRVINSKFNDLVNTYEQVRRQSPADSRIYITGYPQIAKPGGSCGLNVRLSDQEARFSELIIEYLNTVINVAADKAGVYYVDTQDAFNGYRFCEGAPGSVAINGLTPGGGR